MKKYIKIVFVVAVVLFSIFNVNSVFAGECSVNSDCGSGNCAADKCYPNTISSPCLDDSACGSKNCYAGRCCPQTFPMEGSCPKRSMAQPLPAVNNSVEPVIPAVKNSEDTLVLEPEDTKEKDTGMRFSGMTGQVEYLLPGKDPEDDNNWKLAKMDNASFPPGTHIRTQEDSSAILSFSDMSTFVLKQESEVVLDTPPGPESKIKLVAGNIWVNIKKMVKEGSMSIEMNQAVAGIKGTTFTLSDKDGISSIKVIEGLVEFTGKIDGHMENIAAGEAVVADKNGLGVKGTFNISEENKLWEDTNANINIAVEKEENKEPVEGGGSNLKIISGIILLLIVSIFIYIKRKK